MGKYERDGIGDYVFNVGYYVFNTEIMYLFMLMSEQLMFIYPASAIQHKFQAI